MKEYEPFWQNITNRSINDIVQATGLLYNSPIDKLELEFMRQKILVDVKNQTIVSVDNTKIEYELKAVITTYLALAKNVLPINEWVTVNQIPTGDLFFRGIHTFPIDRIITTFAANSQLLTQTCQYFGGLPITTAADVSFQFQLLPKVPVQLLYWFGDDEFPARANFLFDRTIDQFLLLDGILALVNVFTKRLTTSVY